MSTASDLEAALQAASPPEFHTAASHLAHTLAAVAERTLSLEAARAQIAADLNLLPLLEALSGQKLNAGHSLLSFGSDNRIDRIEIGDLAGGNIIKIDLAVDDRQGAFVDAGAMVYGPVIGDNAGTVNYFNVVVSPEHGTVLKEIVPPPALERKPRSTPPRPLRSFIDHEQELAVLQTEFAPGRGAWLSGPAGCGLTALLRQMANLPAARALPDGIVYVDGALATEELDDLLQDLFGRLYHSVPTACFTPAQIKGLLGEVRALVVFDGLPFDQTQLTALADFLVGSAVFISADSPGPDTLWSICLHGLPRQDAMRLVMATCRPNHPPPDGPMNEASQLGLLCAVLDDVPLSLVLAGQLVLENKATFQQLVNTIQPEEPAAASLDLIVRCTLAQCSDAERALLAALARVGPLSLSALIALSEVHPRRIGKYLACLTALGLVSGGTDRYSITQRSLARTLDRLLPAGDERRRAVAFFAGATVLHRFDPGWFVHDQLNLLNAAKTALAEGQPELAGTLVRSVQPALVQHGRWGSWRQVASIAEQAAQRSGDQHLQAWALHEQGTRLGLAGERTAAQASLTQAWQLRRSLGDHAGAAVTQQNMRLLALPLPLALRPRSVGIVALIAALGVAVLLLLLWLGSGNGTRPPLTPTPSSNPILVAFETHTPTLMALPPTATATPTVSPTATLTVSPTATPTMSPTATPTMSPTATPTVSPTATPTVSPTATPTVSPTATPTVLPTATSTASPTATSTRVPGPDLVISVFLDINALPVTGPGAAVDQLAQTDNLQIPVVVTVRNQGTQAADIFKVGLEYYPEGEHPNGSSFAVAFSVPGQDFWYPFTSGTLPPDSEVSFSGAAVFAASRAGSTVMLYAVADSCSGDEFMPAYCRVEESNENNNQSALVQIDLAP